MAVAPCVSYPLQQPISSWLGSSCGYQGRTPVATACRSLYVTLSWPSLPSLFWCRISAAVPKVAAAPSSQPLLFSHLWHHRWPCEVILHDSGVLVAKDLAKGTRGQGLGDVQALDLNLPWHPQPVHLRQKGWVGGLGGLGGWGGGGTGSVVSAQSLPCSLDAG